MTNQFEDWLPMLPEMGPPLPRSLGLYWPWYRPGVPAEVTAPPAAAPAAPVTMPIIVTQPAVAPPTPITIPVTVEYPYERVIGAVEEVTLPPEVVTPVTPEVPAEIPEVTKPTAPERYILYTSVKGEGRTIPPSGKEYIAGSRAGITAVPAAGWKFDHWEGDAAGTSQVAHISIDSDKHVTAVFKKIEVPLEVAAPEIPGVAAPMFKISGGSLPSSGGSWYIEKLGDPTIYGPGSKFELGTAYSLVATANVGYEIDHWVVDGVTMPGTYRLSMPVLAKDVNVVAHFAKRAAAPAPAPAPPPEPEVTAPTITPAGMPGLYFVDGQLIQMG